MAACGHEASFVPANKVSAIGSISKNIGAANLTAARDPEPTYALREEINGDNASD